MPDITMCEGTGCPLAETCYRKTAKPSLYQPYFVQPPFTQRTGEDGQTSHVECAYYWRSGK